MLVYQNENRLRDFIHISIVVNIFVIVTLLVLLLDLNAIYYESYIDLSLLLCVVPVVLFLLLNLMSDNWRGLYVRPTLLFTLGFVIVFFQRNLDCVLGVASINEIASYFPPIVAIKCCIYASIGLCSFFCGNSIAMLIRREYTSIQTSVIGSRYMLFARILFYIFACGYFITTARSILSGEFIYNEEAMALRAGSFSNYSNVMTNVMIYVLLAANVNNLRKETEDISFKRLVLANGWLVNSFLLFFLFLQFLVGDRGPIISLVLANVVAFYALTRKKIRLIFLLLILIGGAFVLTAIGSVRRTTNTLSMSDIIAYEKTKNTSTISPTTMELAGSYNTFVYTVANVPSKRDYFYGKMQLRELVISVPFLYRFVPWAFSDISHENSSTDYCTFLIQGYNRTYGNGSSLLADIYLDFGLYGIIFVMFLIGLLLYKLDFELYYGGNLSWILLGIVIFSFSLYVSRATLSMPLYYFFPSFLILYLKKYF